MKNNKLKELYKDYKFDLPEEATNIPLVTEEFEFLIPDDDFIIEDEEKYILKKLKNIYADSLKKVNNKKIKKLKLVSSDLLIVGYIEPYLKEMISEIGYPDISKDGVNKFIFYNPGLALSLLTFGLSQV